MEYSIVGEVKQSIGSTRKDRTIVDEPEEAVLDGRYLTTDACLHRSPDNRSTQGELYLGRRRYDDSYPYITSFTCLVTLRGHMTLCHQLETAVAQVACPR